MRVSTTFDMSVSPERVAAYLAEPRHLVLANHDGPVVEQSDGPLGSGKWFVLAFDQLRARVEYTACEPPRRVAAVVSRTGRGSGDMRSTQDFVLSDLPGGTGTHVEATVDGDGGWLRWGPLMRASQSLTWRRMRNKIEASA